MKEHVYSLTVKWTGNTGRGTSDYRSYERSHIISGMHKPDIMASSDVVFRGDKTRYNPEELFLASLSSCHMLWFLSLCADHGVIVTDYTDNPTGVMIEAADGSGRFREVTLHPSVIVTEQLMLEKLDELHKEANALCFIANSVNFEIKHICTAKLI